MLFDTHCHLDAAELEHDLDAVVERAFKAGVKTIVIPAIHRRNFGAVRTLAHRYGLTYALGIHPLFVQQSEDDDLTVLAEAVRESMADPQFVAIGEIGLDFFVKAIASGAARAKQEHFYQAQLKLAREHDLPVLLHVRRSQDILLKYLRRIPTGGGIAHAFNGSAQQADLFVEHGFALGMGGELTYARSRNIRRLALRHYPQSVVLETDAPDIPPSWLGEPRRNEPAEAAGVARCLAELVEAPEEEVVQCTGEVALRVLPRLREWVERT
ncbi:MAG: TatD family hydrolase [Pigmentiphaga sp.]|nr:TatD family hydrolase [Pigmentiphaga sp.]